MCAVAICSSVRRRERRFTGERLVEHAGERVDVGARIGRSGREPFGSHVGPGADGGSGVGQPGFAGGPGDAEVDQVGEVVLGDQDVRRLDVAVHQARSGGRRTDAARSAR